MKFTKKTLSIISALSFVSVVTFAITAGQDIELSQYLNGRGGPNFRSTARNVNAVLATGTRARINRVKTLASGNSGLYVTINSGPQNGRRMWIYFNKSSPGMKLVNADGTTTEIPVDGGGATTTRPIVATPGGPPAPSPAPAPAPAPPAPAPAAPAPVPAPPLPVPSPAVSATIGAGLGAVGGLNGGGGMVPPCSDCAGAGSGGVVSGTTSPAPIPAPVAPAPAVVPAASDATDPGLLYFSELDRLARPDAGANATAVRAHKFLVLNGNIMNAGRVCDIIKHSTVIPVGALMPDGSGRRVTTAGFAPRTQAERDAEAADRQSFINRWNSYIAGAGSSMMSDARTALGGARGMDRDPRMSAYAAGNSVSDAVLRSNPAYCAGILPEFNAITSMSAQDLRAYLDMSDAQRLAYLKAHVR